MSLMHVCNSVHLNKVMCGQKQPRGITKALTDFQKVLECHKFSEMKAILTQLVLSKKRFSFNLILFSRVQSSPIAKSTSAEHFRFICRHLVTSVLLSQDTFDIHSTKIFHFQA